MISCIVRDSTPASVSHPAAKQSQVPELNSAAPPQHKYQGPPQQGVCCLVTPQNSSCAAGDTVATGRGQLQQSHSSNAQGAMQQLQTLSPSAAASDVRDMQGSLKAPATGNNGSKPGHIPDIAQLAALLQAAAGQAVDPATAAAGLQALKGLQLQAVSAQHENVAADQSDV